MTKGHHIQPRCHPQLFYHFKQLNIKAAVAHQFCIQKEADNLLPTGATEPSSAGANCNGSCL